MAALASAATSHRVSTPSGRIGYLEQGQGPVALFVHGVLLNSHLWRHQLAHLSNVRRCIAVDLLAHGSTEIAPEQDVSVTANAVMLKQFLDALGIDRVDLVGNDSGGGIAPDLRGVISGARPHLLSRGAMGGVRPRVACALRGGSDGRAQPGVSTRSSSDNRFRSRGPAQEAPRESGSARVRFSCGGH